MGGEKHVSFSDSPGRKRGEGGERRPFHLVKMQKEGN